MPAAIVISHDSTSGESMTGELLTLKAGEVGTDDVRTRGGAPGGGTDPAAQPARKRELRESRALPARVGGWTAGLGLEPVGTAVAVTPRRFAPPHRGREVGEVAGRRGDRRSTCVRRRNLLIVLRLGGYPAQDVSADRLNGQRRRNDILPSKVARSSFSASPEADGDMAAPGVPPGPGPMRSVSGPVRSASRIPREPRRPLRGGRKPIREVREARVPGPLIGQARMRLVVTRHGRRGTGWA
jgi:hypothetical protein